MLKPDERAHLIELLRPPPDCRLDIAVGTTFSLDLISAMMLPLSFALFDWENPDGELTADPLALLEALRRYGDRFTIFCQSGQIRFQPKYPPLITFLEPCVFEVEPPDIVGVFHPKVWALRFVANDESIRYRVLCLSRNLTFDRCWDTAVSLDGELLDRSNAISANHPLGDFFDALPALSLRSVQGRRLQDIKRVAAELRKVRFEWPDGFDGSECKFWVSGLEGYNRSPFGERRDKSLVISPFLSNAVIDDFVTHSAETHLVSRQESLQALSQSTLDSCSSLYFLSSELIKTEATESSEPENRLDVLDGLHAKLYVIDRGWDASVFSGSFNATTHALSHNVEFMLELVGKRSQCGVDQFLSQTKGETGFADLLLKYDKDQPRDEQARLQAEIDRLIQEVKRALSEARLKLTVIPTVETDVFDLILEHSRPLPSQKDAVQIKAWPTTLQESRAVPLQNKIIFSRVSFFGLTPLIAFDIAVTVDRATAHCRFVMNLPLHGAPDDRQDRVLRSLIENRDQLLRYILFLLATGEAGTYSGHFAKLLSGGAGDAKQQVALPSLLETMLRALHHGPAQFERVESLLNSIRKTAQGTLLLDEDFEKIWSPIWEIVQQAKNK